ncbi:MAG: DUF1385 domain-containing protein [Acutalibacteraceae bacterium]
MSKYDTKRITSIGGSALIEGIMMRGPKRTTVAVRTGEEEIYTEDLKFTSLSERFKIFKVPFIRGIAGLIDSMRLSYKALMLSAEKAIDSIPEDEQEQPSKLEKWIDEKLGDKFMKILMVFAAVLGVGIAVLLFFVAPSGLFDLTNYISPQFHDSWLARSVFEGIVRIALFLVYIVVCSQMSDMKRVFMYHGAEHKTIFCYENELELTVENVRRQRRFHPRCGTSFMVIMILVGIIIGLFIHISNPFLRALVKILLLPLSCGLGYELIKLCGKHDNAFTRIIAAPGLWAQRITTKEPDDKMIEVAIKAMVSVIPENGEDLVQK